MPIRLTRTIRFCINDPIVGPADGNPPPAHSITNSFAGHPTIQGFGRYYEIDVTCRGTPDPKTGYFLNIKLIDAAVRQHIIPDLTQTINREPACNPASLLPQMITTLNQALQNSVFAITWRLTPTFSITLKAHDMAHCIYRQRFAFAASHRLHCPELSAEENQQIFGKCNNPNGHGHNYHLEVAVESSESDNAATAPALNLQHLEALVETTILERFDHRNLNEDCPEFAETNPTVENISRITYELLQSPLAKAGMNLHNVTLWETEKTSCVYPG